MNHSIEAELKKEKEMQGGTKRGIKLDFSNRQILVQVQEIQLFEIRPKVIDNSTVEFGFL